MSVGPGPNVTGNVSSTDASVAGLTGDPNAGMASLDPNNSQSANSAQPAGGTYCPTCPRGS